MPGTLRSIAYLESKFQTGDVPTQQDFYDLFASFKHLVANAIIIQGMGDYDASTNLFPDAGTATGSGDSGAIEEGNEFRVDGTPGTIGGILNGEGIPVGQILRALTNAPGQDPTKWKIY